MANLNPLTAILTARLFVEPVKYDGRTSREVLGNTYKAASCLAPFADWCQDSSTDSYALGSQFSYTKVGDKISFYLPLQMRGFVHDLSQYMYLPPEDRGGTLGVGPSLLGHWPTAPCDINGLEWIWGLGFLDFEELVEHYSGGLSEWFYWIQMFGLMSLVNGTGKGLSSAEVQFLQRFIGDGLWLRELPILVRPFSAY